MNEAPYVRLRSNTLPRSFGSQLEREPLAEKLQELMEKAVDIMLGELRKWREEAGLPKDIQVRFTIAIDSIIGIS